AEKELLEFAEKAQIPVAESLMGRDVFPASHPLCTWMVGMHGTRASNMAVTESDLVLALGSRFSDRVIGNPKTFAEHATVFHIDIDPAEINKNIHAQAQLVGDVKQILSRLIPLIEKKDHSEWLKKVGEWKKEVPACYSEVKKDSINPKFMLETVHKYAGDDAYITTEVGQHQMWTAQFYPFGKPRRFVTSGGLGTMGFGTGAAMGIQVGQPNARVVHIAGDGSFRMNCNELCTIARYNLPIVIVLVNNGTLGNVRVWQKLFYEKRYSHTTLDFGPDWEKLAAAYGVEYFKACNNDEFDKEFKKAFESHKPCIVDARVDIDEMILPMAIPGKPIDEQMMSWDN
ncbi:MAG: acetolactate synthase large subunit, partial [Treponema sp.]|nr:acetolactate synthase large subunit [Treponema sp.]